MSETPTTPFSDVANILAELWIDYREDPAIQELIAYGDLAFPLAYAISESIVEATPLAEQYIYEVWSLLLGQLEVEDTGLFVSVLELQEASGFKI
jgi:hypothetical protein